MFAFHVAWGGSLPSGYTGVEYIQGNGTNARILTDFTPNPQTDRIVAEIELTQRNKTCAIWCSRGSTTTTKTWTLFWVQDTSFRFDYDTGVTGSFGSAAAVNTRYTVTVENNVLTWSGGTGYTYNNVTSFTEAGGPLTFFASYWNGTGNNLDNWGAHKLYSFKVWRSNELIHYFVPCKNANGVAVMADVCDNPATLTVEGTFSAGAEGDFIDDSLFVDLTILPIPEQSHDNGELCRPEFVVSNMQNAATWTVGGDIVSPLFDVEYENNDGTGQAKVTVTGKGEYEGALLERTFVITATKLEDANIFTSDPSVRRRVVNGNYVYIFTNAASAKTVTSKRCIFLTDALLVGGGGGGGSSMGGGGGAGGVTNWVGLGTSAGVAMNGTFTVSVGAGGTVSSSQSARGGNGGATSIAFGAYSASVAGGGGGGSWYNKPGADGASGGGGANASAGGAGIDGIGHAGAAAGAESRTGGGGGSGHAGYEYTTEGGTRAGNGGEGVSNNVTGAWVVYGGGGGGGGGSSSSFGGAIAGSGGIGGGGDVGSSYGRGMNVNGGGQGALLVTNCVFAGNINNTLDNTYGGFGIYINNFKAALVEDSLFVTNGCSINSPFASGWVGYYATGSAICAKDTPTTVRGSRFAGNCCPIRMTSGNGSWGGGTIALTGASGGSVIDHCTFIGNTERLSYQGDGAVDCGGALVVFLNNAAAKATVNNCTFAYNVTQGGRSAGGITVVKGDVDIANTVFWRNTRSFVTTVGYGSDVQVHSAGTANLRYSTVTTMDGTALVGANLTYDPETVFPADPKPVTTTTDFEDLLTKTSSYTYYKVAATTYAALTAMDAHLLSPAGYVVNGGAAGPATNEYSPAIDAGDPAADYSNEPSPNGARLNLGAFGNTAEASCTAIGQPEANVEVLYPDGLTRPLVRITMGLESGTAYSATVRLVCTTGGVTVVDELYYGVGNGDIIENKLPAYLPLGMDYTASVTVTAAGAETKYYNESEPASGTYPPYYGKGGGPNVIHVRTGADCKMDGTSWSDAYPDLGTALNSAPGETITEIWLAVTNDYMTKAITLVYPLTIRGGFAGVENSPAERPEGAMTWLDGNNVYRTMEFSVPVGTQLTVERIRFSHSVQQELKKSGKGDLLVRDCLFTDSKTDGTIAGRGIYATGGGTVAVTNCNFLNVIGPAEDSSGGGALYFDTCAAAYVDHCLFVTNGTSFKANGGWARFKGAAAYVNATPTIFSNCRFAGCGAALREATVGGVVEYAGASGGSKLVNCAFVGNSDFQSMNMPAETTCAGAIACTMSAMNQTLDVENCTVAYNITQGKWNAAGITVHRGTVNLKNSIVYGNVRGTKAIAAAAGADIQVRPDGILNMSYSLVTGSETNYIGVAEGGTINIGDGVIYGDPLLVTTTNDFISLFSDGSTYWYLNGSTVRAKCAAFDAHLRSPAGFMIGGNRFFYKGEMSPGVDAGDPQSDYSKEPVISGIGGNGRRVNLGAYGNTPEAAMTRFSGLILHVR